MLSEGVAFVRNARDDSRSDVTRTPTPGVTFKVGNFLEGARLDVLQGRRWPIVIALKTTKEPLDLRTIQDDAIQCNDVLTRDL